MLHRCGDVELRATHRAYAVFNFQRNGDHHTVTVVDLQSHNHNAHHLTNAPYLVISCVNNSRKGESGFLPIHSG